MVLNRCIHSSIELWLTMNNYKQKNSTKGVTLIELMIVIGLFAVILTIAGSGFVLGLKSFNYVENEIYDHQNLNLAATSLIREARVATLLDLDNTVPGTVKLTITRSNNTQVVFQYLAIEQKLYKDTYPFVTGLTQFEIQLSDLDNDGIDDVLILTMTGLDETNMIKTNVRLR